MKPGLLETSLVLVVMAIFAIIACLVISDFLDKELCERAGYETMAALGSKYYCVALRDGVIVAERLEVVKARYAGE